MEESYSVSQNQVIKNISLYTTMITRLKTYKEK